MKNEIKISVCTYKGGNFAVIINDCDGNEVTLEGNQELTKDQIEFLNEVAPACVYTKYKRLS